MFELRVLWWLEETRAPGLSADVVLMLKLKSESRGAGNIRNHVRVCLYLRMCVCV